MNMDVLGRLKADPDSTAATLEAVAAGMLTSAPGDPQLAQARFVEAVVASRPSLAAQMFTEGEIRAKARTWFADFVRKNAAKAAGAAPVAVPKGQGPLAAPEPISVEGHRSSAGNGPSCFADAADPKSGGGANAAMLAKGQPASASAARPQSPTDIRAAGRAAKHIAKTVFEKITMRDGRAIGDLRYSELARYRREDLRSAALLDRIESHCQPAAGTDPVVRLLISAETLERFAMVANAA